MGQRVNVQLKRELYEFQHSGALCIKDTKRLIVGDQMGLGKTVESIAAIMEAKAFPLLVICPASLKLNWEREFEAWTGHKLLVLNNEVKNTFPMFYDVGLVKGFICNYESLKKYFVDHIPKGKDVRLSDIYFNEKTNFIKSVIIDEFHRCKDPGALQSKLVKGIASGKEYIVGMTGTPVVNETLDLMPQLSIIERLHEFGGASEFKAKYESASQEDLTALQNKLRDTCYFRRERTEALDLPGKTRQVVYLDIDNMQEYKDALTDLRTYLKEYKECTDREISIKMRGEVMVRIGILKEITVRGKLQAIKDWAKDVIASEKLVLYGQLDIVVKYFIHEFKALHIIGQDNSHQRQAAIDKFQTDPDEKMMVISKAAAEGVTLTAASVMGIVEQWWNPAIMDQIEDRLDRIGQTRKVMIVYFLGKNTIDQWIYNLIEKKREISNAVTGATNDIETQIIDELLNILYNGESTND
ncbi:MAG: hypothetical protein A2W93_14395 [Bacteroidetes bacterium GWF2_43_63]|nr:MAG: hypothetical protein A2W94_00965 [Bacteroidetes bacterium GWE2_42_42]OFY52662.1 MAG: hypothetical protein A2W93_14395 [Bacteroidetes bacterium GWF2_43_63]